MQPGNPPPDIPPDRELLATFCQAGDPGHAQRAFSQLVARHLNFVYSVAVRRVGDCHLAEDVAQAVFLILSRKAKALGSRAVLCEWLFCTTRYVCANALRARRRRSHYEHVYSKQARDMSHTQQPASDAEWEAVAPLLDNALSSLGRGDRRAVLLRFIEGKSHRDVGEVLGLSEEAARKRVTRALDRLRQFFSSKGVMVPVAPLAAMLTTRAVEAAPASLTVASVGASAGASASLADGALTMIAWAKARLIVACVAAALAVSGAAALTIRQALKPAGQPAGASDNAPTVPVPVLAAAPPAVDDKNPIVGTAFGLDAEPLPGAEVYLASPSSPYRGFDQEPLKNPPQITQKDGKFSFPAQTQDAFVIVRHLEGYAQVSARELARSPGIFIKAWARVEGVLMDGDTPLSGQPVFLGVIGFANDPEAMSIVHQTSIRTANDGSFTAERLPPSQIMVLCRQRPSWGFSNKWERVNLAPGSTQKVRLGGVGRHVIGRLLPPQGRLPGLPGAMPWDNQKLAITTVIKVRRTDLRPDDPDFFRATHPDDYPVAPDGTFRIEDLRPGRYALSAAVLQNDRPTLHSEIIASGESSFVVPPLPDGRQRVPEPLEIGVIRTNPVSRLLVGEPAPDFEVKSLDGKPLKLDRYRGKFLLAWFRFTPTRDRDVPHPSLGSGRSGQIAWYGPSVLRDADWPGLKKVHAAFSNDPQFVMLAIDVENPHHPESIAAAARRHGAEFPLATLPPTAAGGKPLDPAYTYAWGLVLIDPQGNVAAKNFSPANAQSVVDRVLLERR